MMDRLLDCTYWGWQTVPGTEVLAAKRHGRYPYEEVYLLPPPPQSGESDEQKA